MQYATPCQSSRAPCLRDRSQQNDVLGGGRTFNLLCLCLPHSSRCRGGGDPLLKLRHLILVCLVLRNDAPRRAEAAHNLSTGFVVFASSVCLDRSRRVPSSLKILDRPSLKPFNEGLCAYTTRHDKGTESFIKLIPTRSSRSNPPQRTIVGIHRATQLRKSYAENHSPDFIVRRWLYDQALSSEGSCAHRCSHY